MYAAHAQQYVQRLPWGIYARQRSRSMPSQGIGCHCQQDKQAAVVSLQDVQRLHRRKRQRVNTCSCASPESSPDAVEIAVDGKRAIKLVQQLQEARLRSQRLRENLLQGSGNTARDVMDENGSQGFRLGKNQDHVSPAMEHPRENPARKLVSSLTTVDRRVYDQVAASRNRLSKQLSEKNRYIRHLEAKVKEQTQVVTGAHKAMERLVGELEAIVRLSETAVAIATYGISKEDIIARTERISRRADVMRKAVQSEAAALNLLVVRRVPVVWYGVASEVQLMGDFDGWSQGQSLSAVEIHDQVFTRFQAEVALLPGTYQTKLKVDGEWRLAPDWPTVTTSDGGTNNVLIVT